VTGHGLVVGFLCSLYCLFNVIYSYTSYTSVRRRSVSVQLLLVDRLMSLSLSAPCLRLSARWVSVTPVRRCCSSSTVVSLLRRCVSWSPSRDSQLVHGSAVRSCGLLRLRAALATVRDRKRLLTRVDLGLFLSHTSRH